MLYQQARISLNSGTYVVLMLVACLLFYSLLQCVCVCVFFYLTSRRIT
jgi:hypothetical protein